MSIPRLLAIVSLVSLGSVFASAGEKSSVLKGYERPFVTVPYAHVKPKIDGAIEEAEWQGAESMNALQTTRKEVSSRQTRFWMMWDEDNLYIAMRSPLRPGERVIQNLRRRERDINVVFDDSYEVWLDTGAKDPKTGLVCFFQFLCNFASARLDTLHLPSVGNSRLGYETGWEPVNRITPDGKAWEWEMLVPRESVYRDEPFVDGFELSCLLARNFKRPWEQNSVEGTGSFAVLETHSRYRLSKTAPALHLLDVRDFGKRSFGFRLGAYGHADGQVKWRFLSEAGKKEGALAVKKGELTTTDPMLDLVKEGQGPFRLTVTGADDRTLLDWASNAKMGKESPEKAINDKGDVVKVSPSFNPVRDYVRVTGDFIQYDDRDAIGNVRVDVLDKDGKKLGKADLKIDEQAYIEGVIRLGDIPYGEYVTRVTWRDADGKEIGHSDSKFAKKDHEKEFAWWNTTRGSMEKVLVPWTPVTYGGKAFGIWGRTMQTGAAGLPAQVTTQKTKLLAAPTTLVADTGDGTLTLAAADQPKTEFDKDYRKIVSFGGKLGDIKVTSKVQVEFDGMYKVTMTLDPQKPVAVKNLKLVVPFANESADYVHAAGEGIRTGFYYGFLPRDKEGRIWTCTTVDSQPMAKGTFIPYVWVGSTKGGMCWFADSDEGWVPSDTVPAIEVRRDSEKSTDFVLNLIGEPFTIDKPRTIAFAFQASPVKKMHDKWRMDSWWCGDTFKNYSSTPSLIWTAIPYCMDNEKCKEMVKAQHNGKNSYIFGFSKYRANAVPYFIHQSLPAHLVPEVKYFGDQWKTSISECLYYGKTLTDYMVYNYSKWCEETGIDGYYVDNMRPVACDNIDSGRGYKLPDGRIQPTYQMFSTRRYFMRVRAAFAEQGKHDKIVLHMTNNMIIPWVGAADIAYDGEHFVIYPEMGKDFMDFWSLERMRVDYSGQWGTPVNFMHEYQGKWDRTREMSAMRAYTGMVGLHDALPSGNSNGGNQPFWIGRDRFGIENADVEFVGYWDAKPQVDCAAKDIRISFWKRPEKVLLLVVNTGESAGAQIKLDAKALGLPDPGEWFVEDAEAGTKLNRRKKVDGKWVNFTAWDNADEGKVERQGNALVVPVKRHDYRQIIVRKK